MRSRSPTRPASLHYQRHQHFRDNNYQPVPHSHSPKRPREEEPHDAQAHSHVTKVPRLSQSPNCTTPLLPSRSTYPNQSRSFPAPASPTYHERRHPPSPQPFNKYRNYPAYSRNQHSHNRYSNGHSNYHSGNQYSQHGRYNSSRNNHRDVGYQDSQHWRSRPPIPHHGETQQQSPQYENPRHQQQHAHRSPSSPYQPSRQLQQQGRHRSRSPPPTTRDYQQHQRHRDQSTTHPVPQSQYRSSPLTSHVPHTKSTHAAGSPPPPPPESPPAPAPHSLPRQDQQQKELSLPHDKNHRHRSYNGDYHHLLPKTLPDNHANNHKPAQYQSSYPKNRAHSRFSTFVTPAEPTAGKARDFANGSVNENVKKNVVDNNNNKMEMEVGSGSGSGTRLDFRHGSVDHSIPQKKQHRLVPNDDKENEEVRMEQNNAEKENEKETDLTDELFQILYRQTLLKVFKKEDLRQKATARRLVMQHFKEKRAAAAKADMERRREELETKKVPAVDRGVDTLDEYFNSTDDVRNREEAERERKVAAARVSGKKNGIRVKRAAGVNKTPWGKMGRGKFRKDTLEEEDMVRVVYGEDKKNVTRRRRSAAVEEKKKVVESRVGTGQNEKAVRRRSVLEEEEEDVNLDDLDIGLTAVVNEKSRTQVVGFKRALDNGNDNDISGLKEQGDIEVVVDADRVASRNTTRGNKNVRSTERLEKEEIACSQSKKKVQPRQSLKLRLRLIPNKSGARDGKGDCTDLNENFNDVNSEWEKIRSIGGDVDGEADVKMIGTNDDGEKKIKADEMEDSAIIIVSKAKRVRAKRVVTVTNTSSSGLNLDTINNSRNKYKGYQVVLTRAQKAREMKDADMKKKKENGKEFQTGNAVEKEEVLDDNVVVLLAPKVKKGRGRGKKKSSVEKEVKEDEVAVVHQTEAPKCKARGKGTKGAKLKRTQGIEEDENLCQIIYYSDGVNMTTRRTEADNSTKRGRLGRKKVHFKEDENHGAGVDGKVAETVAKRGRVKPTGPPLGKAYLLSLQEATMAQSEASLEESEVPLLGRAYVLSQDKKTVDVDVASISGKEFVRSQWRGMTDEERTEVKERNGLCARSILFDRKTMKQKVTEADLIALRPKEPAVGMDSSRANRQKRRAYRKGLSQFSKQSDALSISALEARKKRLYFRKSTIHGTGLYTHEDINENEFVIEYVGAIIRRSIADIREKQYEREGVGDNYLFKINSDYVIDATRQGGSARFINHSCDPNLMAKVMPIGSKEHIVFYSRKPINKHDELTYDYKYDLEGEDKKISCHCGAPSCRKFMN